jgi:hypothetical protein
MLAEHRTLQLERLGAQPQRIAEAKDAFSFMDRSLNGMHDPEMMSSTLAEVMTSADFTYAIQEFVQRQMLPGYTQKRFNFEPLVRPDTLPNFLPVTRYQNRAGVDDLEYVPEKAPAQAGSVDDATKRQYRVYRWEKQFDFSMEALVNDDLSYFQGMASDMGRAARRTLEKYVSRMYTNATSIARLIALGALYSTTGRLTSGRISTARMAFNQRTDGRGEPIMATLSYLVHHTGLIDTVRTIQASQLVPELATNAANVIAGTFQAIEDPYIVGTAPNLPWWAFTRQEDGVIPLVLARRQGMPGPMLARKRSDIETFTSLLGAGGEASPIFGDFATGNVVVKVMDVWGTYIDVTAGNLFDERGVYYSSGTAA